MHKIAMVTMLALSAGSAVSAGTNYSLTYRDSNNVVELGYYTGYSEDHECNKHDMQDLALTALKARWSVVPDTIKWQRNYENDKVAGARYWFEANELFDPVPYQIELHCNKG